MTGRRWADGLHQAVEAKEGVQVKGETQTFATITIQNYFRMYDKLAGMTGTAETEETEFYQIYGLEVNVIPTNRPVRRLDQPDRIYKTRKEKYNAILDEVERLHGLGWPMLIGTVNVDVSETLSRQLKRRGLKHEVLNAKYHQREAEIVAGAGQKAAITIATNMAGRGTDIKLGKDLDLEQPEAGLQIIGTERHESRRIDRQLRGRSGRQGDPGQIDLLPVAGRRPDAALRLRPDRAVDGQERRRGRRGHHRRAGHPGHRAGPKAGRAAELPAAEAAAGVRRRDEPAAGSDLLAAAVRAGAGRGAQGRGAPDDRGRAGAGGQSVPRRGRAAGGIRSRWPARGAHAAVPGDGGRAGRCRRHSDHRQHGRGGPRPKVRRAFRRKIEYLADFGKTIGIPEVDSQVLSQVMLSVLDERWKDHLYDLDQLRNAIQYRAWGQKDPLVEYKREAFEMFEDLMHDIQSTFTERFLKIQVSAEPPRQEPRARRPALPEPAPAPVGADDMFTAAGPADGAAASAAPALSSSLGPVAPCDGGGSGGRDATIPVPAARERSTRSATGLVGSGVSSVFPAG